MLASENVTISFCSVFVCPQGSGPEKKIDYGDVGEYVGCVDASYY